MLVVELRKEERKVYRASPAPWVIDHIFALLLSSWLSREYGIALGVACRQWRLFIDSALQEDSPAGHSIIYCKRSKSCLTKQ